MTIKLRLDDYTLAVTLDDRVKRLLIQQLLPYIKGEIAARGYNPADDGFDQGYIEDRVWALAGNIIQAVEEEAGIQLYEGDLSGDDLLPLLQEVLDRMSAEKLTEFVEDPLGGIDGLIMLASGNFPAIA